MSITLFDLELPDLSTDQAPAFTNADECQKWLAGANSPNARQTQAQLLRQLNLLNRYALPADERLRLLELLHTRAGTVYGECSVRYTARALPLAPPELAALETCQSIWQALEIGYLHCAKAHIDEINTSANPMIPRSKAALAGSRALACLLAIYMDDCRAGMAPAPFFWRRLHRIYRGAERLELANIIFEDAFRRQAQASIASTYLETILLAAANPLEFRQKQLAQVAFWAQQWTLLIPVLPVPPADLRTPPMCIDLAGDEPGVFKPTPVAAENLRWLDLANLRRTFKQCMNGLAQGESPELLGLGKDCTQPDCEILFKQVYQDWCRGGRVRSIQGSTGACQLVNGIEAIHYFLSGDVFREPHRGPTPSRNAADDELALSYTIEDWHEINEDVTNLFLQRPLGQPGKRMAKGQLVAVRTSSNDSLQIGKVRWMSVNAKRDILLASIDTMPGPPIATTLYTPGTSIIKTQYCRGFLLPAIEGLGESASVLTPANWFQPDHVFQIFTDGNTTIKVRPLRLIERGLNFERCTYEVVD